MKVKDVKNAYNALSRAKISKLDDAERLTLFRIRRALKPIAEAYNEFEQDAINSLKCDGFDDMATKADAKMLQGEELVKWANVALAYNKALASELKLKQSEEVEVILPERLSEATAIKIINENDWQAGAIDNLEAII